ncbi:hypothetical protein HO133_004673 [Letharia lupina]|uniref:DSC E3 ubiquitin ligase complex subunit 3 C-terminal domain-containing protein n=1 Tax=Letharia lupina TaxID=560253 RepID=A0A8H6FKR2_9LECA|nr:uncharacterized protein HO133_004673 [Letharia lupina]KAF6230333.1 hypothetical protein HO133_004673 [Letharia lupina]
MPPTPPPPPTPPLTLIIRFTTSLPDLPLPIVHPRATTPTTLATLIRPHLPPALAACPLRLIHAGALLPPTAPLHASLRLSAAGPPPARLYVHCSIATGARLSPAELDAEAESAAVALSQHDTAGRDDRASSSAPARTAADDDDDYRPTLPPPAQGFDRLLSAGLSAAEIAALRSQFLAVQAHTHTPDAMPSGAELRALEERWLDAGTPLDGGGGADGDEEGGGGGGLEDMLWGNVMGFFWAVGAIVWLVREEGVWTKRRQVGVVTGVLVNIAFCMLRVGV